MPKAVAQKTEYISYEQAIAQTLRQEMERDPRVFVYGLDVSDNKKIFGSTKIVNSALIKKR